jgi:hypothetical protein
LADRSHLYFSLLFGVACSLLFSKSFAEAADKPPLSRENCRSSINESRCYRLADKFLEAWPKAMRGDFLAMREISFCYLTGCSELLLPDLSKGCGWQLVILDDPRSNSNDRRDYRTYCSTIAPAIKEAAFAEGDRLSHIIRKKPLGFRIGGRQPLAGEGH